MYTGLPSDFPSQLKLEGEQQVLNTKSQIECAVFIRSELPELDIPVTPIGKKPRIDTENQVDNNKLDSSRKVKFCSSPPVEFIMCADSEYDRSTDRKICKWKKYLTQ